MKNLYKNIFWAILTFVFIAVLFSSLFQFGGRVEEINLNKLADSINRGEVAKITAVGNELRVEFKDNKTAKARKESEAGLSETLKNLGVDPMALRGVELLIQSESGLQFWLSVLIPTLLPLAIIIAILWFFMRQAKGGASQVFSFGKSNVRLSSPRKDKITFADVAGLKEAKEELEEVVDFLKNPKKYLDIGAKIPRGVLLIGPPGCGKTLIARAIAGESNVPFFHISASEFVEMFVGVGSARVRDLFQTAKKAAPCLSGDTLVTLADGKEISIQEMFDKKLTGVEVPSLSENLTIENAKVIGIIKRSPKRLYEIKTYHSSIKATSNHLFPRLIDGKLEWIELSKLEVGDRIAAPRKIKTGNRIPSMFKLLPLTTRIYLKSSADKSRIEKDGKRHFYSVKLKDWSAADFGDVDKIAIGKGGFGDSWLSRIPEFLNPDIMYLKGLIDSDGCFPVNSWSTSFVNTELTLHQRVNQIVKENFDYQPKTYLNKKYYDTILPQGKKPLSLKDCYTTVIGNKLIRIILKDLDKHLLTLSDNLISNWLRGVFDGDGYVANENNDPKIVIVATDRELNERIKSALHRLGIIAYSTKSSGGGSIEITGKVNVKLFMEKISSSHPVKIEKMRNMDLSGKSFWRIDQIPIGALFKRARASCGMGQRQFANGNEVSYWERNVFMPSRENLVKRIYEIENWLSSKKLDKTEEISELENLVKGGVFWSKITSIKELPKPEAVFDLSLDKNFNFLANKLFVHNCIIFIDEIDAVGRERGAGIGGGHDEREQTLNQILVEMDGFERDTKIVVTAASNRPDILDPALLRPGRFDRRIILDLPDIKDREEILKIHARNKPLEKEVDLNKVAVRTPGFSGADLENLLNESAILTARKNRKTIIQQDIFDSVEKVLLGPERKSRVISEKEKKITAYHEAGHALVTASLKDSDPVHKVSIVSRGRAGGYTLKLPTEEVRLRTRTQFLNDLAVMMAGYSAEEEVFGDISTGASNDLKEASRLSRALVTKYGMSELGPITFGKSEEMVFLGREIAIEKDYSEVLAAKIDKEVQRFIKLAHDTAKKIIETRRKVLDAIAETLIKKETLEQEEFYALLKPFNLKPIAITV